MIDWNIILQARQLEGYLALRFLGCLGFDFFNIFLHVGPTLLGVWGANFNQFRNGEVTFFSQARSKEVACLIAPRSTNILGPD